MPKPKDAISPGLGASVAEAAVARAAEDPVADAEVGKSINQQRIGRQMAKPQSSGRGKPASLNIGMARAIASDQMTGHDPFGRHLSRGGFLGTAPRLRQRTARMEPASPREMSRRGNFSR